MTFFVRWVGRATGVQALAVADVTLWRCLLRLGWSS